MEKTSSVSLFTEKSDAYAKYRPGYPDKAFEIILNRYNNFSGIEAVDVGAGTGISSRLLAENGTNVKAIEANADMISSAWFHDRVTYIQGKAEFLPVRNNTADLVTSFQAFHWFDFKKSLKEFNRILKSSGRLALIWSYWDQRDFFTNQYVGLINNIAQNNPNATSPYDGIPGKIKKIRVGILWKLKYLPFFRNVKRHKLTYEQEVDLQKLVGCAHSQSYIPHNGPLWDKLLKEIDLFYRKNSGRKLVYRINIFTADPVK